MQDKTFKLFQDSEEDTDTDTETDKDTDLGGEEETGDTGWGGDEGIE